MSTREILSTEDILDLVRAVNVAIGKAKSKKRLRALRDKLQFIGRSDADAINSMPVTAKWVESPDGELDYAEAASRTSEERPE